MTNRPIKFRAWDKKQKRWIVDFLVKHTGELVEFQGGYAGYDMEYPELPENYDLMQFTGLTDKNGKEIYEGDVLEMPTGRHATVGFLNGSFTLGEDYASEFLLSLEGRLSGEHIGNVFENKELLNHD